MKYTVGPKERKPNWWWNGDCMTISVYTAGDGAGVAIAHEEFWDRRHPEKNARTLWVTHARPHSPLVMFSSRRVVYNKN